MFSQFCVVGRIFLDSYSQTPPYCTLSPIASIITFLYLISLDQPTILKRSAVDHYLLVGNCGKISADEASHPCAVQVQVCTQYLGEFCHAYFESIYSYQYMNICHWCLITNLMPKRGLVLWMSVWHSANGQYFSFSAYFMRQDLQTEK